MSQHAPVTFGRSEGSIEAGGFRVTEAAYGSNLRLPRHEHPFPSWTAVLAGGFEERFRDGGRACRSGAVLAKPGHATHSNVYGDEGARVVIVEITDAAIAAHPELHGLTESTIRVIPAAAAGSRVRTLRAELRTGAAGRSLGVHSAVLDLGLLLLRTEPRARADRAMWLGRVTERLRSEFVRPPSLAALAADCGVHPVYLCAAFRAAHGCSPGQYVRRLRIEHARRLLTTTRQTISAIAFASGFSDQSHLTRHFRAATGMTPGEYRRRVSSAHRVP